MRTLVFTLGVFLLAVSKPVFCQDRNLYQSKWQLKPSAGIYFSFNKLLKAEATDNLISYADQTFYWQVISASYFFHPRWGIDFSFQGGTANRLRRRNEMFANVMTNTYSNQFFVSASTGADYDNFNIVGGHVERGYAGLIYRYETKKFFLHPKLLIGVTSFQTDWGTIYLKEKNANKVFELSYRTDKVPSDQFTVATAASTGYKLSNKVYFSLDLLLSFFKSSILYQKTLTDLTTGVQQTGTITYNRNIYSGGLGTGLIIVFK